MFPIFNRLKPFDSPPAFALSPLWSSLRLSSIASLSRLWVVSTLVFSVATFHCQPFTPLSCLYSGLLCGYLSLPAFHGIELALFWSSLWLPFIASLSRHWAGSILVFSVATFHCQPFNMTMIYCTKTCGIILQPRGPPEESHQNYAYQMEQQIKISCTLFGFHLYNDAMQFL